MKEIRLPELLNLADAAAHDGICDLWNQKTIHFLVVFTSPDQDFELIGVGPTLPYNTLEAAEAHSIPNKKAEFYVKCPAAVASRLQPKLAPTMARSVTHPPTTPALIPSLKGRTVAPFMRPALKLPAKTENPEQNSGHTATTPPPPTDKSIPAMPPSSPTPVAPSTPEAAQSAGAAALDERERTIARREHELSALAASLKIREAALRDREAALAAVEERLLNLPPQTE